MATEVVNFCSIFKSGLFWLTGIVSSMLTNDR